MNMMLKLYDFFAGSCFYFTLFLCLSGLARKTIVIISGRRHGLRFPDLQTRGYYTAESAAYESPVPQLTFSGRNPVLAVLSIIFHISIIAAPLTAGAHMILIDQSFNIMLPWISQSVTGFLTWTAIITGLILLMRRLFLQHVLAVSSWKDYAAMICVLTPFVTGLLARELIGYYEAVIVIHCASAHILLIAIGWTRLGHMIFFAAGRFAVPDIPVTGQV